MELLDRAPFDQLPRYIVVEGPIGVGKTTLVTRLGHLLEARSILEIFEENPFLADFYRDRHRYAFQTEMFFLLSRYRQQESFAQEDLFSRFSISDYLFGKCRLFAGMTLSDHELALFDKVYGILSRDVPRPDLVIYLHAPVNTLIGRISERGRDYERDFDAGYLRTLLELYTDFFSSYDHTPLLTIDTTGLDFRDDNDALANIVGEMVRATKEGRRDYRASAHQMSLLDL